MKTNQIFNFNRFCRYAKSSFIMHYRQLLLLAGAVSASLILYVVFITTTVMDGIWSYEEWQQLFLVSGIAGGLLYVGNAFSPIRKKESTINFLLIPASTLEKYIYEFFEKILLFWLLFPTIYYVFGNLATEVSKALCQIMGLDYNIEYFSFNVLSKNVAKEDMNIIIILEVIFSMIVFAGAATFKKHPLIKTVVFCGAVVAIVAGYFYVMIEKLNFHHPWVSTISENWSDQQGLNLLKTIILVFSAIVLVFAYFKLKEREVS